MSFTVKLDIDGKREPGQSEQASQSAILHALQEEVEKAFKKNKIEPDEPANYGKCTYTKQVAAM